jgi:hypothetical protein
MLGKHAIIGAKSGETNVQMHLVHRGHKDVDGIPARVVPRTAGAFVEIRQIVFRRPPYSHHAAREPVMWEMHGRRQCIGVLGVESDQVRGHHSTRGSYFLDPCVVQIRHHQSKFKGASELAHHIVPGPVGAVSHAGLVPVSVCASAIISARSEQATFSVGDISS